MKKNVLRMISIVMILVMVVFTFASCQSVDVSNEAYEDSNDTVHDTCSHICHSDNPVLQFVWSIIKSLSKATGFEKYCICHRAHY